MSARQAILDELSIADGYGLDLIERVERAKEGAVKLHQGNAYPLLRDMEREGLIESYEGETVPDRADWPRVYYRITERGRSSVGEQRRELPAAYNAWALKLIARYRAWKAKRGEACP